MAQSAEQALVLGRPGVLAWPVTVGRVPGPQPKSGANQAEVA